LTATSEATELALFQDFFAPANAKTTAERGMRWKPGIIYLAIVYFLFQGKSHFNCLTAKSRAKYPAAKASP